MNVLRGPADADHYRVRVGRYGNRFYADPLPADDTWEATDATWPSVSSVKKASGSDWSFVALKRVAGAELDDLPKLAFDERYERLKTINKLGLERAGARGTQVHAWLEAGLRGQVIAADPDYPDVPGADYLPAVQSFFATYQPRLVAAEIVSIHRTLGYGGTSDAVIEIDGKRYWVDWKSRGEDSDHGAYPEEGAQLGAYARAEYVIVEGDDGPQRIRPPDVEGGLIVSIKPDGVRLYPVDLDKAFKHWQAMLAWWTARRSERDAIGKPWAPRKIASVEPQAAAPDAAGEAGLDASPASIERRQWIVDRVKALNETGKKYLGKHWPEGIPTFKHSDAHTDADLDLILPVLIKAEAEIEAPFPVPDPTTPAPAFPVDTIAAPSEPDEGPDVSEDDLAAARTLYLEQQSSLDGWADAVHQAGRSLNLKAKPSLWRWTVVTSLAHVARAGADEDMLRELMYGATRGDQTYLMTANPIGALIASLSIPQAERLGVLARALDTGQLTPAWASDGAPQFSGPAWDAA